MHPSLSTIDHRPWPLPPGAWSWRQSWRDLLFAHWPVPVAALQALAPEPLHIQEFDGTSWVGVVPFRMQGVMHRPLPDLPWVSAFPELNLRLYVEYDGKPGVWFLSLDATNFLAVWAARLLFHLPYHRAQIDIRPQDNRFAYASARSHGGPCFRADYGPTSPVYHATPGTLEHWLTERYCLYALAPDGELWRTEVHHAPWPLQQATAAITENSMLAPHGLSVDGPPALLHFARQIDVVVWSPRRA